MATDIKWIKNEQFLVVVIPGRPPITLTAGTKDFKEVAKALSKKAYGRVRTLLMVDGVGAKGVSVTPTGDILIDDVVQDPIISELVSRFKEKGASYAPLVALGRKISKISVPFVREQLSRFLQANKVSITPDGCFLAYKAVRRDQDGKLVDCHSGKFDNSIGKTVKMKRSEVEQNPHITCAPGLHVAALGYLGELYSNNVHVVVKVDPLDVVSVPYDYQDQKMRTCQYTVLGLLDGNKEFEDVIAPWASSRATKELVRSINEAADADWNEPSKSPEYVIGIDRGVPGGDKSVERPAVAGGRGAMAKADRVINLKKALTYEELAAMSAKKIVETVLLRSGKAITCSIKSKDRVLRKACDILGVKPEVARVAPEKAPVLVVSVETTKPLKLGKTYDFGKMSAREIVAFVKKSTGKLITANLKSKQRVVAQAEKLMKPFFPPLSKQQKESREMYRAIYGGKPSGTTSLVKTKKVEPQGAKVVGNVRQDPWRAINNNGFAGAMKILAKEVHNKSSSVVKSRKELEGMTGKEIILFTKRMTGVNITCSPKSKNSVINAALRIFSERNTPAAKKKG